MATTQDEVKRILHLSVKYEDAVEQLGKYRKEIDDITKQIKDLKKTIETTNMSPADLKTSQTHLAALDQELKSVKLSERELSKEMQNTIKTHREQEGSLRSLRAELSNLTKQFDSLSAAERNGVKGNALMTSINDITKQIKDAESATQRFYRNVGNYQSALEGVSKLKQGFSALSGTLSGILGGLGLEQLTSRMIDVARNFEDGIARVRAVANPLLSDFQDLRDMALELGATTRYTSTEVANGMEELARKGLSAKEVLEAIKPTLELAQANVVSIADAAQVSSSAMRAFGLQTEDLAHINDVLSSTSAHSASTLNLLGEAMKTAGPAARTANISLEETSALIGSLANVGMTGSDAGTGIKQVILALASANTTKKGLEVLKKYNIELNETRLKTEGLLPVLKEMKEAGLGESMTDLKTLTGKYASPRIANLINNIDQAIALNDTLQDSLGENERMFDQSIGTTSNAIYTLQSAWDNMLIRMNDSTSDYLVKPMETLTSVIRYVGENIETVGSLFVSIVTSVALTPVLTKLGTQFRVTYAQIEGQSATTSAKCAQNAIDAANRAILAEENRVRAVSALRVAEQEEQTYITQNQTRLTQLNNQIIIHENQLMYSKMGGAAQAHLDYLTTLLDQEKAERDAINNRMLQNNNATQEARTRADEAASQKRIALEEEEAAKREAIMNTKGAGIVNSLKNSAQAVAGVLNAVWSTVKIYVFMAAITEVIQLFTKWYQEAKFVEEKISDIKKRVAEIDVSEPVKRLTALKRQIQELQEIQNKSKTQQDTLNGLLETARRSVNSRFKNEQDIIKALDQQIARIKEMNRLRIYQDEFSDIQRNIVKASADKGYNIYDPTSETAAREAFAQSMAKGNIKSIDKSIIYTIMNAMPNQVYKDTKDSAKKLEAANKAFSALLAAVNDTYKDFPAHTEDMKDMLLNWQRQYNTAAMLTKKDAQSVMSGTISVNGTIEPTPSGDYQSTPDYSGSKGKNDPTNYLNNLLTKYQEKYNSLVKDNIIDSVQQQEKEINNTFETVKLEIQKVLNNTTFQKAEAKGGKYAEMVGKIKEYMGLVEEQAEILRDRKLDQLYYDKNERIWKIENAGYSAQISLAKSKTSEFFTVTEDNLKKQEATTLQALEDIYQATEKEIANNNAKAKQDLERQFVNGELSTTATVKQGSRADVMSGYEEYESERDSLEYSKENGLIDDSEYSAELQKLNAMYEAEAAYYERLGLLEAQQNQEQLNRQKLHEKDIQDAKQESLQKQYELQTQALQNQISQLDLNHTEEVEKDLEHHLNIEYGTNEYYDKLKQAVGEYEAEKLQLEIDAAQQELDQVVTQGQKTTESVEQFNARKIAAEQKYAQAKQKATKSIVTAEQNVYSVASTITGGLVQLTEALGESDTAYANISKILAVAQCFISSGEAIAKMTAAESGKGIAGIATMAAGIAAILGNIATAVSTIRKASFAGGGKVTGAGTGTSDSIPANLSNGEFVMTAKATKLFEPLLMVMNGIGAGVAIPRNGMIEQRQTSDLIESLAKVIAQIRPVVSVEEISDVSSRVQVIQSLDNL